MAGELALPEEKGDGVNAVAWAPNIGRLYRLIMRSRLTFLFNDVNL